MPSPVCETCGGSKRVLRNKTASSRDPDGWVVLNNYGEWGPCPDCTQESPSPSQPEDEQRYVVTKNGFGMDVVYDTVTGVTIKQLPRSDILLPPEDNPEWQREQDRRGQAEATRLNEIEAKKRQQDVERGRREERACLISAVRADFSDDGFEAFMEAIAATDTTESPDQAHLDAAIERERAASVKNWKALRAMLMSRTMSRQVPEFVDGMIADLDTLTEPVTGDESDA